MPSNASMASIAWLVTTTSARLARLAGLLGEALGRRTGTGGAEALVGGDRHRPPGPVGRRRGRARRGRRSRSRRPSRAAAARPRPAAWSGAGSNSVGRRPRRPCGHALVQPVQAQVVVRPLSIANSGRRREQRLERVDERAAGRARPAGAAGRSSRSPRRRGRPAVVAGARGDEVGQRLAGAGAGLDEQVLAGGRSRRRPPAAIRSWPLPRLAVDGRDGSGERVVEGGPVAHRGILHARTTAVGAGARSARDGVGSPARARRPVPRRPARAAACRRSVCSSDSTSPSRCAGATRSPAVVRHEDLDLDAAGAAGRARSRPAARRCPAPVRAETTTLCGSRAQQPGEHQRVGDVGLVDDDDLRDVSRADLAQHLAHRRELALGVRVRAVDHVQDEVGVGRPPPASSGTPRPAGAAGAGRTRRCRSSVKRRPSRRRRPAHGRVERGEQRVLDQHARAGQPVEQAGLAGVGVAGDRDRRHLRRGAARAAWSSRAVSIRAISRRSLAIRVADPAAVGLDLGLAGPTAADAAALGDPATGLAGQVDHPSRAAAAAGTAAGPARPGPCPRGSWRAGRRCRGSARCGR